MFTLRRADPSDFPSIYKTWNTPAREKFLIDPLDPEEAFLSNAKKDGDSGREHYYLLRRDDSIEGFIRILVPEESCEIWGRALRTLFYHCARIAFDELKMKRLWWQVRQNNLRMIRVCELYRVRVIGSMPFWTVGEKLSFVAAGTINLYELTPDEYRGQIEILKQNSLPISNFL